MHKYMVSSEESRNLENETRKKGDKSGSKVYQELSRAGANPEAKQIEAKRRGADLDLGAARMSTGESCIRVVPSKVCQSG
jgi:hypothetical protein